MNKTDSASAICVALIIILIGIAAVSLTISSAQALLFDRGSGLIYDSEQISRGCKMCSTRSQLVIRRPLQTTQHYRGA